MIHSVFECCSHESGMDVSLSSDEYMIFLDTDDCALLQLGSLTAETQEGSITLRIGICQDCISLEEGHAHTRITISPAAYGTLLHMSFAVSEASGKRIWLRLDESRLAQHVMAET